LVDLRTKLYHRAKGIFKHTADSAFPASMRRANYAGFDVRKQNGDTIGGHYAKKDIRLVGDHRVAPRRINLSNVLANLNNIGGMELVDAGKPRVGQDRVDRASAIFDDGLARIFRTKPYV
jgi:hypothetical protein